MQHQGHQWEREYKNPKLVTLDDKPQADTLRFLKFLKKDQKYRVEGRNILDLGCGTGRNSNYLADLENSVIGIEISNTALQMAKDRAKSEEVSVDYRLGDIGSHYDIANDSVDVILDITSSNALHEKARAVHLNEMHRVLKKDGYIFVRALCKDGNDNVKNLLKASPGPEYDTYYMKELDLIERVFSRVDIIEMYSKYFKILKLEKRTGYARVADRSYKRDYWLMYLQK